MVLTLSEFIQCIPSQLLEDLSPPSWEYPNQSGIGCNVMSPNDSANFLLFLQELRQDPVGSTLIISAAVSMTPFTGSDGKPMSDVSAFADSLDWIGMPFRMFVRFYI